MICGAALAAGHAVKQYLEQHGREGRVVIFGCPAEEGGSGKVYMQQAGALDDIGAVMMVHPSQNTQTDSGCTAKEEVVVEFFGKTAHAAAAPERGINALDAMLMLFNATSCWRQQLPEDARLHGVITDGGIVPNVIPDYTRARFYLRSTSNAYLMGMLDRFKRMVEAACLMTGCTHKYDHLTSGTKSRAPNCVMNERYRQAMEALGQQVIIPSRGGRGSTDFGNFATVRPGIHPYFSISPTPVTSHSVEITAAANSDYGRENMLRAAAAMGDIALAYLTDATFREAVQADFDATV